MKIASGSVFIFVVTLLVYVYLFYINLKYVRRLSLRKSESQIDWSTNSPMDIIVEDQILYPNLPIDLSKKIYDQRNVSNDNFVEFPQIFDLHFGNDYWQVFHSTNETFHLFNAYYDNRKKNPRGPSIRILGMINAYRPTTKTYCQLWFENIKTPILTERIHYHWMWRAAWKVFDGIYQPYLLTCYIPPSVRKKVPSAVSVVEIHNGIHNVMATNVLRLIYNEPFHKKQFSVCVKGLDYFDTDISVRLVEWIELLKILGADNIYFYKLQVHPNVSKVLEHYQALGFVNVIPYTLPGEAPNMPLVQHNFLYSQIHIKRFNEVIMYNDCLYRNLYSYKHIALLDIDEIIIPQKTYSWGELLENVDKKYAFSICARVGFFLDKISDTLGRFKDIPAYMHMLQHVYRSKVFPKAGHYTKCFHNPNFVVSLHNHFPFEHFGGSVIASLRTTEAVLHHFRHDCLGTRKECVKKYLKRVVLDKSIWKYKNELIVNSVNTLKKLKFL